MKANYVNLNTPPQLSEKQNQKRHASTWNQNSMNLGKAMAILTLLVSFQFVSLGQTIKDVLSNTSSPIIYLGIDFTKTKVIDDLSASAQDIHDRQFAGINEVVLSEPKKYDLTKALHRSYVDHDLSQVQKRNEKVNPDQIMSGSGSDMSRLKPEDISSIVSGYDFSGKTGTGLLFVMEAMSKSAKVAIVWVTFIDMKSKKVLLTERIEGKTGMSFGFRNFWATAIHSVIETIEKKKYKEWSRS